LRGQGKQLSGKLERETGFETATPALAVRKIETLKRLDSAVVPSSLIVKQRRSRRLGPIGSEEVLFPGDFF
jgi:hypothetical protein